MVPTPGALATMAQLLARPATCAAAVTMLGKTVELCGEGLLERGGSADALRGLSDGLAALARSPAFSYDVEWIRPNLTRLLGARARDRDRARRRACGRPALPKNGGFLPPPSPSAQPTLPTRPQSWPPTAPAARPPGRAWPRRRRRRRRWRARRRRPSRRRRRR